MSYREDREIAVQQLLAVIADLNLYKATGLNYIDSASGYTFLNFKDLATTYWCITARFPELFN